MSRNPPGLSRRRRLVRERVCYVCGAHVAPGQGVIVPRLTILVCVEGCYPEYQGASRDYSRSERGRRLPEHEVLRRLEAVRR